MNPKLISGFSTTVEHHTHNVSSANHKARPKVKLSTQEMQNGCRLGTDSHADISCVGRHAKILSYHEGKSCTVHPFNDSYSPMKDVRTVNVAFAYDTDHGDTHILLLNQALDFTDTMNHSILCTNQARMNGVKVNDIPKLCDNTSTQSIIFPEQNISIPL